MSCAMTTQDSGSPSQYLRERSNFHTPLKRVVKDGNGRILNIDSAYIDLDARTILYFSENRAEGALVRRVVQFDSIGRLREVGTLNEQESIVDRMKVFPGNSTTVDRQLVPDHSFNRGGLSASEQIFYDPQGRLRTRLLSSEQGGASGEGRIDYDYDSGGAITSMNLSTPSITEIIRYRRDSSGRIVKADRDVGKDGAIDFSEIYAYDSSGNLVTIEKRDALGDIVSTELFEYVEFDSIVYSPTMFAGEADPVIREFSLDTSFDAAMKLAY